MHSQVKGEMPQRSFTLLRDELGKQIPRITLLVVLAILGTGIGLIQPLLFKVLLDSAIPDADVRLIALLLVGMVIVPMLSAGLNSTSHYLRAYIGEGVSQRLRQELFDHLLHARLADLEQFKTGEHIHRLTRSCGKIGEVYVSDHLLPLVLNAILLVGTLAAMTALNWRLSLLALLAFPLSYLLTRKTRGHAHALYNGFSNALEAGQSYLNEIFPGLRTIRAFNAEAYEQQRWREWLTNHRRIKAKVATFHELIRVVLPEFISSLPHGYQTILGEQGMTLSGGERQRLAIARILLQRPRLLLLDEATAALDALTDQKVRAAIAKVRAGRTAIAVSHRLTTILDADRILVIDQGRIVEMGSPAELLARPGLFFDLYQAQSFDLHRIAL